MTVREDKKKRRDLRGFTAAGLFIVLAFAVLLVGAGGVKWYVGIYVALIGLGAMLIATGTLFPGRNDYGATSGEVRMVRGVLLAVGGAVGLLNEYVIPEWWVSVMILLLIVGLLILYMTMKGMVRR